MIRTLVLLVNFKGAEDTEECVQSLVDSKHLSQLLVIDNTPNDPKLKDAVSIHPKHKIIRASENLGFSKGNNLGIKWALANSNFEYLFILNNDTVVEANSILSLENAMDDNPECGIISPIGLQVYFSHLLQILG